MPAPYLLVYDAERLPDRRLADWVRSRDRRGLVTAFPCGNGELALVAPELAGRPLHLRVHGLDLATREVHQGPAILPHLLRRLPGWGWLAPLARIPALAGPLFRLLSR